MKTKLFAMSFAVLAIAGTAFAAHVEKTDGFVCPVFNDNSQAGAQNPNAVQIGGGSGSPGGPHSSPGDTDYTAVWSGGA